MLTLHQGVPVDYRALLLHLLTPAIWAQKGSRRTHCTAACLPRARRLEANRHTSVLGIAQQRLVPSRANDGWGFELLQSIVLHAPLCVCFVRLVVLDWLNVFRKAYTQPYFRQIIMTLLTQMQQNKTNNYVYYFVHVLLYLLAVNAKGISPDHLFQAVDEIQSSG